MIANGMFLKFQTKSLTLIRDALYAHRTDTKQYMKPVDADVEMLKEMFREKIGRDWLEATRDNDESLMGFKGSKPWEEIQIAAVKRPLMSVGRICDEGHNITFDNIYAVVRDKEGQELCQFHREPSGGLYVAKLRLKSPAGFGRLE